MIKYITLSPKRKSMLVKSCWIHLCFQSN